MCMCVSACACACACECACVWCEYALVCMHLSKYLFVYLCVCVTFHPHVCQYRHLLYALPHQARSWNGIGNVSNSLPPPPSLTVPPHPLTFCRTPDWLKVKTQHDDEAVVTGHEQGSGKHSTGRNCWVESKEWMSLPCFQLTVEHSCLRWTFSKISSKASSLVTSLMIENGCKADFGEFSPVVGALNCKLSVENRKGLQSRHRYLNLSLLPRTILEPYIHSRALYARKRALYTNTLSHAHTQTPIHTLFLSRARARTRALSRSLSLSLSHSFFLTHRPDWRRPIESS